jgi:cysteine desulfurase
MNKRIYFDNAATTRVDDRVIEVMLPYFSETYGNASSLHTFGTYAKEALDRSREQLASFIGANAEEVIFTSGGTESNNFALKGVAWANRKKGNHIIVSAIEHDCVINTCKRLEDEGFYITYLPVDSDGIADIGLLERSVTPQTILVSVMYANNEIGTVQPMEAIGEICRKKKVLFHSDACQAFGKIPIDVNKSGIDLMTVNAHKIYGPKGMGALYIRKGVPIVPLLHGGGQEGGYRSTTENIPAIVGFAKATELCANEMREEANRQTGMRKKLTSFLEETFENVYFNGHPDKRLPGLMSFSFHGLEGETIRLLLLLDETGIAVSAGSACSSNDTSHQSSHVLMAIGLNQFEARGAIRVSLGRFNTNEDIENFKSALGLAIPKLNAIYSL